MRNKKNFLVTLSQEITLIGLKLVFVLCSGPWQPLGPHSFQWQKFLAIPCFLYPSLPFLWLINFLQKNITIYVGIYVYMHTSISVYIDVCCISTCTHTCVIYIHTLSDSKSLSIKAYWTTKTIQAAIIVKYSLFRYLRSDLLKVQESEKWFIGSTGICNCISCSFPSE